MGSQSHTELGHDVNSDTVLTIMWNLTHGKFSTISCHVLLCHHISLFQERIKHSTLKPRIAGKVMIYKITNIP